MATILHNEPRSTVSLWYLNRTSNSAMLLDDLQDLRDRFLDRLSIAYAFSREDTGSELLSGRPDRARFDRLIEVGLLPADVDHAFLCGPLAIDRRGRGRARRRRAPARTPPPRDLHDQAGRHRDARPAADHGDVGRRRPRAGHAARAHERLRALRRRQRARRRAARAPGRAVLVPQRRVLDVPGDPPRGRRDDGGQLRADATTRSRAGTCSPANHSP